MEEMNKRQGGLQADGADSRLSELSENSLSEGNSKITVIV